MAYKRPTVRKEPKPHPIEEYSVYGYINTANDDPWISKNLADLHDDSRFALHQFSSVLDSVNKMEVSHLKPEAAKKLKMEMVLNAKRSLMSFLKKHREYGEAEVAKVQQAILRATEPESYSDPIKALQQEMRLKEIRENLKQIEPRNRRDAIAGRLERLQAVVSNPDPGDIIIDQSALTELRREYAFKLDPSLVEEEKDQKEILRALRKRAGDVSATSVRMLIYNKLDDPLPPLEFFETFPPQTEHEGAYAEKRIQAWERRALAAENREKFDEADEGLNLEAGERVERLKKGIKHE